MRFLLNTIRYVTIIFSLLFTIPAFTQNEDIKSFPKPFIVKTNLFSLLAQRPTFAIEKVFSKKFSAEFAFVQGHFNNILYRDYYAYNGFLLRAKRYFLPIEFAQLNPFAAVYLGNLKRHIQTEAGLIGTTGWFGYPSKDFFANSIRGGCSLGCTIITKNKIVVELLTSMGYGRYTKIYKEDINQQSKGYLDAQVWFSIGYSF
jgi:hypothetical protein